LTRKRELGENAKYGGKKNQGHEVSLDLPVPFAFSPYSRFRVKNVGCLTLEESDGWTEIACWRA
jgi:hypothetical protein